MKCKGNVRLPKSTLKRLLKEAVDKADAKYDYDFRVSAEAVEALEEYIINLIWRTAPMIRRSAQREGRKTIKEKDIKAVLEQEHEQVFRIEHEFLEVETHEGLCGN